MSSKPPEIEFALVNGRLVDTVTGLPAYSTINHLIIGRAAPPPEQHPLDRIFLENDGTPADPVSEYLLKRDMIDFLSVWNCRPYPEPSPPLTLCSPPSEVAKWPEWFDRLHPPIVGTEFSSRQYDDRLACNPAGLGRHASTRSPASLLESAPSDWHRAVTRRLAMIFEPRTDALVRVFTETFLEDDWNAWLDDKRLVPFYEELGRDERKQRLLDVLCHLRAQRFYTREYSEAVRAPRYCTLRGVRGKYLFRYPTLRSHDDATTRAYLLLWRIADHLGCMSPPDPRLLAAGVYLGRNHLVRPKSLAARQLTQQRVASYFRISRRQLQTGLRRVRDPGYGDFVWKLLQSYLKARRLQQT